METTTTDLDMFIGDPNGGDGQYRSNGVDGTDEYDSDVGDPCSSCAQPLLWDRFEQMVYCVNDWYHG